jgi:AcrR family transcriptional regulator
MDGNEKRGPGTRAGLDRDQVLAAAREQVEREGAETLTMRRLADRLGVAPNTLYSHYPDKASLLDDVLDSLLAEVDVPGLQRIDWRDGLVGLMEASRSMLLRHADLLPHLLSRPMRGPNASHLAEETLTLLARGGIDGPRAVDALRALLTFTFGSVVLDAPRRREPDTMTRESQSVATFGARTELARVAALAGPLSKPPDEDAFRTSLRWLLDGIAPGS